MVEGLLQAMVINPDVAFPDCVIEQTGELMSSGEFSLKAELFSGKDVVFIHEVGHILFNYMLKNLTYGI